MTFAKASLPGFDERFATVRGRHVRYFLAGQGEPLVLVHGLGGGASNWAELAPLLALRRRVLVPDLPGHGGSEPLPAAPNLNPFAECLAALARRESMCPASFVGHSFGGLVALRLAIRRPELVTALVLAAAAGVSSTRRVARYVLSILAVVRPARFLAPHRERIASVPLLRYLAFGYWGAADPPALPPRAVEGFLAPPALHTDMWSAARAILADDPRLELDAVTCPSLVLWGGRDRQLPVADALEYARRLGAPLRVIADCGHLLIAERPEVCRDAIEGFLAKP